MKKVSRVLIAVAAGVFLAGLLLEASLWFLHLARESRPLSGKESFTILCVGNSITKGDGAPKGESYPELLEKQLLAENLRVKVVNGGESNATTTLLLRRLPRQLEDLKPKIVTFMVGDPNYWFNYGLARYLARRENSSRALKIRAALETYLFSLRSVNWLRIFLSQIGRAHV